MQNGGGKMSVKTKAQQDMELAAQLVGEVKGKNQDTQKIYGGLCHSFPVLVRQCGLCQALAFSESKSKKASDDKKRADAHRLIIQHVGALIGHRDDALKTVQEEDATQYMLHTRRVLSAWIYFKRFAESILGVESAEENRRD